jgi:GPI transamidase subunit PIG-U
MNVIQATYGMGWNTIRPSLSVQWYFAKQLFSRFLGYFSTLIFGLPYILAIPTVMRLYRYPIALVSRALHTRFLLERKIDYYGLTFLCPFTAVGGHLLDDLDDLSARSDTIRRKFVPLFATVIPKILGARWDSRLSSSLKHRCSGDSQRCRSLDVAGTKHGEPQLHVLSMPSL